MKRRDFIKNIGMAGSAVAISTTIPNAMAASISTSTTKRTNASPKRTPLDGIAMANLVRTGQATPKELAQEAIEKIKLTNGTINAVVNERFDAALKNANNINKNAPFAGVPLLVKDCVDVAGMPSTNGSLLLQNNIPQQSSDFVVACKTAGFNVLGMTHSPEFTSSASTESILFGTTRNPWNLERSSGGSSGGSGAAVAAGYTPIVHGTDGGGSCRIPASMCGIFGYKPSRNLLISGAVGTDDFVLTHSSFMSRSVRDTALAASLTENHVRSNNKHRRVPLGYVTQPIEKKLRIGVSMKNMFGDMPDTETQNAMTNTIKILLNLGHEVIEVTNPVRGPEFMHNFTAIFGSRLGQLGKMVEAQTKQKLEDSKILGWQTVGWIREFEHHASKNSKFVEQGFAYQQALDVQMNDQFYKSIDVWLTPVTPDKSHDHTLTNPNLNSDFGIFKEQSNRALSYTPIANMADNPSISVPLYWTRTGLPIGSMFSAARGNDRTLFGLAYELENASPWAYKTAPHFV
ncbi:Twin-arginine translocation signal domain-containing protein [Vibrio chagasii]|nr:Twin-arginine translocation signal domain-containing protein [Vibrio chagasii]CAH7456844.1 Twin-arginine translocation signal domain-containing protein [Vibrio chagasii]